MLSEPEIEAELERQRLETADAHRRRLGLVRGVVLTLFVVVVIAGTGFGTWFLHEQIGPAAFVVLAIVVLLAIGEGLWFGFLDRRGRVWVPIILPLLFHMSLVAMAFAWLR